jgi:PAS domain S-box-containing protein
LPSDSGFLQLVFNLESRIEQLEQAADDLGPDRRRLVTAALEEYRRARAELGVAWEELHAANRELLDLRYELELERRRYRELFELAPDGYVVSDSIGTIREANRAAATLLNVTSGTLVGKPLAQFVAPEDRRVFRPYVTRLRHAERPEELWVALRPRGRPPFPGALTAVPFRDQDGAASGIRWLLRNVSERQKQETALQKSHQELSLRLMDQTAQLTMANSKLRLEIARRAAAEERLAAEQRQAQDLIAAVSAPVLQIGSSLLLMPLIGVISPERAALVVNTLLHEVRSRMARAVIVDLTATTGTDDRAAACLAQAGDASRLLGAPVIFAGISSVVSRAWVESDVNLDRLTVVRDLQDAMERAESVLQGST